MLSKRKTALVVDNKRGCLVVETLGFPNLWDSFRQLLAIPVSFIYIKYSQLSPSDHLP